MYDNYIALDWAQENMAIARMTKTSDHVKCVDIPSNIKDLRIYLNNLRGSKIMTLEETSTSQWLYVELKPFVDELIICDPYRNKLLSEGAKNDVADAIKLVKLLRSGMLKPVYHSSDKLISLRKLMSSYDDLIQRGVRLKNQRSALFREKGQSKKNREIKGDFEPFILKNLDRAIAEYEHDREIYVKEFEKVAKRFKVISHLKKIPGIELIGATKIASTVVSSERFPSDNHFLSYCGLVRLEKLSGGKSYGYRMPRYNRQLKSVFKTAALSAITHEGEGKEYYLYLMKKKNYPDYQARHAVARKLAVAAKAVMKNGNIYDLQKIGVFRELVKNRN